MGGGVRWHDPTDSRRELAHKTTECRCRHLRQKPEVEVQNKYSERSQEVERERCLWMDDHQVEELLEGIEVAVAV